jgi:nucleoside-diphosphate-sugar epimerase
VKVLITGAGGFVGAALTARLVEQPDAVGTRINKLILADLSLTPEQHSDAVEYRAGDIGDFNFLDSLIAQLPDVVFHLASIPGGAAERDPQAGSSVNLHATVRLFEGLRNNATPPVVVFASTVAVYGIALPSLVDANTPLRPVTSYGAHKLMTEYLLSDLSRRGELDGRCLRFPGIVARPRLANGHVSAFMSNIFHTMRAGEPFVSPVSPEATCWWMSVGRCVDNVLHAARIDGRRLGTDRVWPLPVLRHSMGDVVTALGSVYGADRARLVSYSPVEAVETVFGRYPELDSSAARALGFRDDGSLDQLIRRAMSD